MKRKLMKTYCQHLIFLIRIIFLLFIQVQANYTDYSSTSNLSQWNSSRTNATNKNWNTTEANRKLSTTLVYASGTPQQRDFSGNKPLPTSEIKRTVIFQLLSTEHKHSVSTLTANVTPSAQTSMITSKGNIACAENNSKQQSNKSSTVTCVIIIGVLVLICTALLISTVVLANQVSNLKKSAQSKRQARSNRDFLITTNSVWPLGLDLMQKRSQPLTEVSLTMENLPSDVQAETKDEAEKSNRSEEMSKGNHNLFKDEIPLDNQNRSLPTTSFLIEI
ncbi:protein EVI2A [Microcaecilia unicolor]|uniref:Protein EVI2A n=1 Tax=Microcaecilia unicolor TaxID=1415580 RepID=A0A6P7ZX05_9AMPH|nr:protein EVI2A [Microcaecilia unicolor]XP_030078389.1 protein EVI2A [Microcaecilia unicolor]XP_030078391.1 protein EVI2A [Microcaecilia unicolor]XP_030078392.1 protein EVI2A [Microcaecilia unicolor]XP_030078393.1 protein EVI2A [Microcaecilia unicolor]XP_030078394.1 protein EVI2A [Microcaecilia unicolor]